LRGRKIKDVGIGKRKKSEQEVVALAVAGTKRQNLPSSKIRKRNY
jgi:hypothetical protein